MGFQPGRDRFIRLLDTPASYSGQTGQFTRVNAGETALEFAAAAGGGQGQQIFIPASIPTTVAPGWGAANRATHVYTQHRVLYIPIAQRDAHTWADIVCEITTAGNVGSLIRLGIYNAQETAGDLWEPGSLLIDAGTVPADAIAIQSIAIAQALADGAMYFLYFGSDATGLQVRSPDENLAYWSPISSAGGGGSRVGRMNSTILFADVADGKAAMPDPAVTPTSSLTIDAMCAFLQTP